MTDPVTQPFRISRCFLVITRPACKLVVGHFAMIVRGTTGRYAGIPVIDTLRIFYDEEIMNMNAISFVTYRHRLI